MEWKKDDHDGSLWAPGKLAHILLDEDGAAWRIDFFIGDFSDLEYDDCDLWDGDLEQAMKFAEDMLTKAANALKAIPTKRRREPVSRSRFVSRFKS